MSSSKSSKMSSSSSEKISKKSSTKTKYPNTWKFVRDEIVPKKLQKIDEVVRIYVKEILKEIRHQIRSQSETFKGAIVSGIMHLDPSLPRWLNELTGEMISQFESQIVDAGLIEKLETALEKDDVKL